MFLLFFYCNVNLNDFEIVLNNLIVVRHKSVRFSSNTS